MKENNRADLFQSTSRYTPSRNSEQFLLSSRIQRGAIIKFQHLVFLKSLWNYHYCSSFWEIFGLKQLKV